MKKALDKKQHNYLISLVVENDRLGLSSADLSTGDVETSEIAFANLKQTIENELARLHPVECILPEALYNDSDLLKNSHYTTRPKHFPVSGMGPICFKL